MEQLTTEQAIKTINDLILNAEGCKGALIIQSANALVVFKSKVQECEILKKRVEDLELSIKASTTDNPK